MSEVKYEFVFNNENNKSINVFGDGVFRVNNLMTNITNRPTWGPLQFPKVDSIEVSSVIDFQGRIHNSFSLSFIYEANPKQVRFFTLSNLKTTFSGWYNVDSRTFAIESSSNRNFPIGMIQRIEGSVVIIDSSVTETVDIIDNEDSDPRGTAATLWESSLHTALPFHIYNDWGRNIGYVLNKDSYPQFVIQVENNIIRICSTETGHGMNGDHYDLDSMLKEILGTTEEKEQIKKDFLNIYAEAYSYTDLTIRQSQDGELSYIQNGFWAKLSINVFQAKFCNLGEIRDRIANEYACPELTHNVVEHIVNHLGGISNPGIAEAMKVWTTEPHTPSPLGEPSEPRKPTVGITTDFHGLHALPSKDNADIKAMLKVLTAAELVELQGVVNGMVEDKENEPSLPTRIEILSKRNPCHAAILTNILRTSTAESEDVIHSSLHALLDLFFVDSGVAQIDREGMENLKLTLTRKYHS